MYILHPNWGFEDEMSSELPAMENYFKFNHGHLVGDIPTGSEVMLRFRALPFGREMEEEIWSRDCSLVNLYNEHRWAADIGNWYPQLETVTPKSWKGVESIPLNENGPFFVKGETNSRRDRWATHAYAKDRSELGNVIANLQGDSLIKNQEIWIRKFVELNSPMVDVVGMPVSEEYRLFIYDGKLVASGFYWANHLLELEELGFIPDKYSIPNDFFQTVVELIDDAITFVAVDVAKTAIGDWIVVEVNDGQMAGLCGCDAGELYSGLRRESDDTSV